MYKRQVVKCFTESRKLMVFAILMVICINFGVSMKGKGLLAGILVFIAAGFYLKELKVIYSGDLVAEGKVIQTVVLNGSSSVKRTQDVAFSGVINGVMRLNVSCVEGLSSEKENAFAHSEGETSLTMLSWNTLKVVYTVRMKSSELDAKEKIGSMMESMEECKVVNYEK